MATGGTIQPQPQKRRVRKRLLIPGALLLAMLVVFGWLYWRGTRGETVERNPASADEKAVTQLMTQDGRTFVRSAVIVPKAAAAVWMVVTDYDSHPKFMPYIAELSKTKLDDTRVRLKGLAHSRLWGDFRFEIDVTHEEKQLREFSARWHEENKSGFAVNRGSWTMKQLGADQTLLVFTKQAEIPGYPDFLIRNILMNRVGSIVEGVRDEVIKRANKIADTPS